MAQRKYKGKVCVIAYYKLCFMVRPIALFTNPLSDEWSN